MSQPPLRLDVLIRTSQRKQEAKSPQQQRDICEACATVNGYEIAAVHDSGGSESGKTMVRSTVGAALKRLHAGETDGVMVAFLDRFGRAPIEEAMAVVREIHAAGGILVPADAGGQPVRPDDPQAETNLVMQLQFARQQWLQTASRFERNRANAIKEGKAIGRAPFGYRFADPTRREKGRGVVDSHLVIDEDKAKIVRELFERKASGASWLELARWLDAVAPKPDGRRWSRTTVNKMITCRTYLGEVRSGDHVNPDAHVAIISPGLYRRAQNEPGHRTPRGTYLLSGLVRCSGCGRHMRASSGGTKKQAVYVCVTAECALRYTTVVVANLDAEVEAQVFALLAERQQEQAHLTADNTEHENAVAEVARLNEQLNLQAGTTPSHPTALAAHNRRLAEIESDLVAAEDREVRLRPKATDEQNVEIMRSLYHNVYSFDDRREWLRRTLTAVMVRRARKQGPGSIMSERIYLSASGDVDANLFSRARVASWTWDDNPRSLRPAA